MANYWTTPKINWVTNDGIGYEDLNRIEANISANRDANFNGVRGFGYTIDNSVVGEDGVITFNPGSCYSENGYPIRRDTDIIKNLATWAQGSGSGIGGVASAVTVAAHTWYYAFVIMDPDDGSTDVMIDDNPSGTNISSGTFTEKRFINSFKTGAAGGDGSFDLVEMYSTGNRVYINPDSMYAEPFKNFPNAGSGVYNEYHTIDFDLGSEGEALPAKAVRANLNIRCNTDVDYLGLISKYENVFTIYDPFMSGGEPQGEFTFAPTLEAGDPWDQVDIEIMITAAREIELAMNGTTSGETEIAVRGFTDERLL